MNNKITNVKISYTQKISQSDKSVLIQIDDNKAVWIAKKYIHQQLRRLTPNEKSNGIKLDVNNQNHVLKGLYSLGIIEDYLYDVMTTTKDETGKFNKTSEILSGKVLALQAEKYSDQCYKKYLAQKQKETKKTPSNTLQRVHEQHLNLNK